MACSVPTNQLSKIKKNRKQQKKKREQYNIPPNQPPPQALYLRKLLVRTVYLKLHAYLSLHHTTHLVITL